MSHILPKNRNLLVRNLTQAKADVLTTVSAKLAQSIQAIMANDVVFSMIFDDSAI